MGRLVSALMFAFLLSQASPGLALLLPLAVGIYDLVPTNPGCSLTASCELTGSFHYDPSQANPFTAWDFRYEFPTAAISGATWTMTDGGQYLPNAQSIITTDPQNLTLTFQLCAGLCSTLPNAYAMDIFDNTALLRYSASGLFAADVSGSPPGAVSVPEPRGVWALTLGLLGLATLLGRWRLRS